MTERRWDYGVSYDRTNQCWIATLSLGHDSAGKRQRETCRGKTKAQAKNRMDERIKEMKAGVRSSGTYTVKQCTEDWLGSLDLDPGTVSGKRSHAKIWIYPEIGSVLIRDLKLADIDRVLGKMAETRSRQTLVIVRSILRRSLRRAQQHDLIERNVAELADIPVVATPPRKSRAMTVSQATAVLNYAEEHDPRMYAVFVMSFSLAPRPGEIRGLRWDHADLDNRVIHLWRQLKNEWSKRSLRVPQIVIDALKAHRDIQAQEREAAGSLWQENELVFCMPDGTPYTKEALRWRWSKVTKACGLGHWHPHEGRHTGVSILDHNGVKIRDIADFVGHRNDNVTKTVYRHILTPEITTGADVMDTVFRTGEDTR